MKFWLQIAAIAMLPGGALAQTPPQAAAGLPAPFGPPAYNWAAAPGGGAWGSTASIERGPHGEIWAIGRCGANNCDGSDLPPVFQLDLATGKTIKAIGQGLFVFPHGLHVDRHGNVWVTDSGIAKDGTKGLQVIELSPEGKVLMRLGTAGKQGADETHFSSPTDVITAPNGDIYVSDGHSPIPPAVPAPTAVRIMKFSKDGKFLKQWGSEGSGPVQFSNPHALALDAKGRLFVADRGNNRTQIFDSEGNLLGEWKQLGRPSGYYIDAKGSFYSIDADSTDKLNPGFPKGIWIGDVATGKPTGFVPDDNAGEGVVIGPDGNMYGAVNVAPHGITKYPKR